MVTTVTTKEELATKVDVIDWFTLRGHLERGALLVINGMLDLAEVGAAIANDEVHQIERWIASGMLSKPTVQQIESWDAEKSAPFLCLIISPYVLIQQYIPAKEE